MLHANSVSLRILVLAALLALMANSLPAEITYLDYFGGEGGNPGQLLGPWGVAVDPATGDVFVSEYGIYHDTHYDRVQKFDRYGNHILGWSTGLERPTGVDVSALGQVYVSNHFNHKIDVFTGTGGYVRTFGTGHLDFPMEVAVGPDGKVYVADEPLQLFDAAGGYLLTVSGITSRGVECGPDGNVYVADVGADKVLIYDSNGGYLREFSAAPLTVTRQLAVNSMGDVYVVGSGAFAKFTNTGTLLSTHAWGPDLRGIAVSTTGELYLVDADDHIVRRFFDSDAWTSGQNHFASAAAGPGELLGTSQTLSAGKSLLVDGVTTLKDFGRLEICDGDFTTGSYVQESLGTLALEIDQDAESEPLLSALGSLTLDGTLEVTLETGFLPEGGDRFELLEGTSFTGEFDVVQLADLPAGLGWDDSMLYVDGSVTVIPEPGTLSIVCLGVLAVLRLGKTTKKM